MAVQRATVMAVDDPAGQGRLQVSIPATGSTAWAQRVFPLAAFGSHGVEIGTHVWVAFEDDDPDRPVVLGLFEAPDRRAALSRDLEALGDAWDQGHAAGSSDAAGGDTVNPYRR